MDYGLTLSDILNSVDSQSMFLMIVFLVSFALLFFSLNRVLNRNNAIAGVIAFALALGITYGINLSEFDLSSMFSNLGVSGDIAFYILLIVALIVSIYIIWKFSLGTLLMSLGLLFIALGYFAYEKAATITIGVVLFVLGFIVWLIRRKKKLSLNKSEDSKFDPNKIKQQGQQYTKDLQKKYNDYARATNEIFRKVGNHIPMKGTSEYNQYYEYARAMKSLEDEAKRRGIKLT